MSHVSYTTPNPLCNHLLQPSTINREKKKSLHKKLPAHTNHKHNPSAQSFTQQSIDGFLITRQGLSVVPIHENTNPSTSMNTSFLDCDQCRDSVQTHFSMCSETRQLCQVQGKKKERKKGMFELLSWQLFWARKKSTVTEKWYTMAIDYKW